MSGPGPVPAESVTPAADGPVAHAPTERIAGALLVLAGVAVGLEASTFEVEFLTDPVGPKALPYLVAAVFVLAGARIVVRPVPVAVWPAREVLLRMAGAIGAFVAYAALLSPLGFTAATTLVTWALALLFGGPPRRAFVAALGLAVALWYLFVWALSLPLPLGTLWTS